MKRLHKNEKGFTLVELMVVVVIIGILVAIAVPIYNNVTGQAEENAIKATERTLNGAWQMYLAASGSGQTATWPDEFVLVDSSTGDTAVVIDGRTYNRTDNVWEN